MVAGGASAQRVSLAVELRSGTCAGPGEAMASTPAAPLGNAASQALPPYLGAVIEALDGPAAIERTTIEASLAEIGGDDHAVGVLAVSDAGVNGLACGELGVFEPQGPDIQVGLRLQDGSGRTGVAWLHDNGDGTTSAWVVVTAFAGDEETAPRVDVYIVRSIYGPDPLGIQPGTTVTWTNEDRTPHTVTDVDYAFDSGYLAQEDTYSRTFDTPGTFAYFCVYHPRMRGTVIVE